MNNFDVPAVKNQLLELVQLLLVLLLVVVDVFVQLPLSVQKHVAEKLLDPCHHRLRLPLKILLVFVDILLSFFISLYHLVEFLLGCFEEVFRVLVHCHDLVFLFWCIRSLPCLRFVS